MLKKLNKYFHTPRWLFILLVCLLILRVPSFFEPYSYGDEMIYLSLGEAIRRGIPLYSQIHDNKPPLLYLVAAIAGSLFWFKAILAVWHLMTVFIFWKLSETLFPKNKKGQIISTILFGLLTTIPLLEGNIANAELFMVGPTLLAFILLLAKKPNFKNLFFAGVFFSLSTLFKVPAAFDVPVIIFLWFASEKLSQKTLKKIAMKTVYLSLGFLTPIVITLIWYFLKGAFYQYLSAAFFQNVGYLSTWRPADVERSFLLRNAPLIQRLIVVLAGLAVLFWKRKRLSKQFIFLTAWLLLSLFAVTLSERPYPHYLIQSIPAISFLVGILLTYKNLEQSLAIIPLSLAFLVPVYFKFWYYPTSSYYLRFIKLLSGQITKEQYLLSFGEHVPRNYKIAQHIASSTKVDEKVFVWGDSSIIYALSRRFPPIKYIADYHIADFSSQGQVVAKLNQDPPSMVVILPNAPSFSKLDIFLRENYGLVEDIDGASIWKYLGQKVRSLISR